MTTIILLTSLWLLQLLLSSSYIPHSWYCFTNSDGRGWGLTIRLWYSQRTSACQSIAYWDKEWFGMTIWWFTLNSTFMVMIWLWLFYASISREHKNDNYTTTATNTDRVHDGQIWMAGHSLDWWIWMMDSKTVQRIYTKAFIVGTSTLYYYYIGVDVLSQSVSPSCWNICPMAGHHHLWIRERTNERAEIGQQPPPRLQFWLISNGRRAASKWPVRGD